MLAGAMTGPLPLDGLRVLELGHIIAGPSAGLLLADLGADVIKVERPGEGDQTRGMPAGNGANFHFLNRNKRSITIDLKGSPEGRALFLRLARGSDIVIDNFAYGAVEGLGLGYDVLRAREPAASSTWRSRASCPGRTRRGRSSTSWRRCRRGWRS